MYCSRMAKRKRSRRVDLIEVLSTITEPRVQRTRHHELVDVLFIALCTLLSGGTSFTDMADFGRTRKKWLKGLLGLRNGIPSHDTFGRVLSVVDPREFLGAFALWTRGVREAFKGEVVAIDGKALRRARDAGEDMRVVVGAWAAGAQVCLGQLAVDEKSNEITALPPLLQALALENCIVTVDAMGCQKEVAAKVREKGAHYVLALKGNQGKLFLAAQCYLDEMARLGDPGKGRYWEERREKKTHGRKEVRRCWACDGLGEALGEAVPDLAAWKDLRSVALVECERTQGGKTTVERRYYITSLPPGAKKIASAVRSHWGIENSLHWSLDVTFREDESRARAGYAAENLSALRRLALNVLKKGEPDTTVAIRRRMNKAAWDEGYLTAILATGLDA